MNVIEQIQEIMPQLTKIQTKVAKYILDNPNKICFSSLKKMATDIGVTESTVLAFCKKTEYENFLGLKKAMEDYLQAKLFWNDKLQTSSEQYDTDERFINSYIAKQTESVKTTFESMNYSNLLCFVEYMGNAETIFIGGHGSSLYAGRHLQRLLKEAGAQTELVDVNDFTEVLSPLTHFKESDVFILIILPFYSQKTLAVAEYLSSSGGTVLALTDKLTSPIVSYAKATIFCNTQNMVYHNSYSVINAASEMISSLYILKNKEAFNRYNEKVKQIELFFKDREISAFSDEYNNSEDAKK